MAGIVPEPNESEAPLTNAQQDEEGSNSEDGNLGSHSVTIEEIEIIEDLLEFEALMQIIETASINLLDLFCEFEVFALILGNNSFMPSEEVLVKEDCLFQEMIGSLQSLYMERDLCLVVHGETRSNNGNKNFGIMDESEKEPSEEPHLEEPSEDNLKIF